MEIPTEFEVSKFCDKNRLAVCPHVFYEYYNDLDWMVGLRPMSSWKFTLRQWDRKERKRIADLFNIHELTLPTLAEFACFVESNFSEVSPNEIDEIFTDYFESRLWEGYPDWQTYVKDIATERCWS